MQTEASTWEQVPGEMILSFQYDSMMCNRSTKHFEDFSRFVPSATSLPFALWHASDVLFLSFSFFSSRFAYIGAPFRYDILHYNSGLSLRNRTSALLMIQQRTAADARFSEEGFFCLHCSPHFFVFLFLSSPWLFSHGCVSSTSRTQNGNENGNEERGDGVFV